jgi:quinol monooxygenase YgiN
MGKEIMTDKITLIVNFRVGESIRSEFLASLQELFTHIVKEPTFVEASLIQHARDRDIIVNYEVWNETPDSFMQYQMTRGYRAAFEKLIVDLKIERTPAWFSLIGEWKRLT